MQLISRDHLLFELKIDHLEDLFILSEILLEKDIIYATTKRKVAIGNDKTKQVTKIMYVELEVQKAIYDTDILRIQGFILNETEFTAIGQSHTLSFQINDTIKLKKQHLLKFQEIQLEKSFNSKKHLHLGILMDKEELIVFEFSEYGFKVLLHERELGSKNNYATHVIDDNKEKFTHIKSLLTKEFSSITIAGPGNFKKSFQEYLKQEGYDSKIIQFNEVSPHSIQNLISKLFKEGIIEETQIAKEQEILDELLKRISNNTKFSYGQENSYNQISQGSVETLIVSTKFIQIQKEQENYLEFQQKCLDLEQLQGNILIINSKHTPGSTLDGLGGIATLNRY